MNHKILRTLALAGFLLAVPDAAFAQMNNRPYSFRLSPGGGVGMSIGGQQAILNDKLLGVQPKNLVRDQNGYLLDITKGPGSSAIVSSFGTGAPIPGFHGRSYTGDNPMMAVGVFNNYFIPSAAGSGCCSSQEKSGTVINTWTARVVSGGIGVSYNNDSLVDVWTGQVFSLGYY